MYDRDTISCWLSKSQFHGCGNFVLYNLSHLKEAGKVPKRKVLWGMKLKWKSCVLRKIHEQWKYADGCGSFWSTVQSGFDKFSFG